TVVLIEHNLDVIKNADWVIDLGPGAGDKGGKIIATGTPEQLAANAKSSTGKYLKRKLKTSVKESGKGSGKASGPAAKTVKAARKTLGKSKAKEPAVAVAGD
ncbi:MAG: hypothetical protein IIB32_14015, partial [Chloroflexi bacterium]|nr:hypothetical protein [Chloroflexota bacterium]